MYPSKKVLSTDSIVSHPITDIRTASKNHTPATITSFLSRLVFRNRLRCESRNILKRFGHQFPCSSRALRIAVTVKLLGDAVCLFILIFWFSFPFSGM